MCLIFESAPCLKLHNPGVAFQKTRITLTLLRWSCNTAYSTAADHDPRSIQRFSRDIRSHHVLHMRVQHQTAQSAQSGGFLQAKALELDPSEELARIGMPILWLWILLERLTGSLPPTCAP